jgi:hypothetical protein
MSAVNALAEGAGVGVGVGAGVVVVSVTGVYTAVSDFGARGFFASAASMIGDVTLSEQAEIPRTANADNGIMARVARRANDSDIDIFNTRDCGPIDS